MHLNQIKAALLGLAVGDALGVPAEFKPRQWLQEHPITDMVGNGTYNLPPGTWSDDSSLSFCLAEVLSEGFDLMQISQSFVQWAYHNYWTPRGTVFDIGVATSKAIGQLAQGVPPHRAGGSSEWDNGNGSLMRILPLLFECFNEPAPVRFELTKQVSALTHAHIRSVIACFYYLEFAREIMLGSNLFSAYERVKSTVVEQLRAAAVPAIEVAHFNRLLNQVIYELPEHEIASSGYVVHTLEASIWCLLSSKSYPETVLKAVNLGEDTDSTAAVTGGLAGLYYGLGRIPEHWLSQLARYADIVDLAERLYQRLAKK